MVPQSLFQSAMLDASRAVPDGLTNPNGTQASKRFDVYRNNVAVGLTEALEAAFPVVRKLVGDAFFRAMAGVFLRKHPPKSPLMMFYGQEMPQFLRRFPPAKSVPYLPDIALLELRIRQSYHAADSHPIFSDALARIAPEALMSTRLKIAPSVWIVRSDYPIHTIYRANTESDAPPNHRLPETVLVTRPHFDPKLHKIDAAAAVCIQSLIDGRSLGHALAESGSALDLGAVLSLLLANNAIVAIH